MFIGRSVTYAVGTTGTRGQGGGSDGRQEHPSNQCLDKAEIDERLHSEKVIQRMIQVSTHVDVRDICHHSLLTFPLTQLPAYRRNKSPANLHHIAL